MSKTKATDRYKVVGPEAYKLLSGEVQRKILGLLRSEQSSICDVADKLDMTPQAIYHHIKKLEKAGLVHIAREERCGHLIESHYQATAENFICYTEEPKAESAGEDPEDILNELNKTGFRMEVNKENLLKLTEIQTKRKKKFTKLQSPAPDICTRCGSGNFFVKSGPIDLVKLDHINHYANLILMTDEEYEERVNNERELRHFLRSICQEKPKA